MRSARDEARARSAASMGPQLVSCGCARAARRAASASRASMGPQLVSCGCPSTLTYNGHDITLQWGRSS